MGKKGTGPGRKGKQLATKLIPGPSRPSDPSQIVVKQQLSGPGILISTQASTALLSQGYVTPSLSALNQATSWKGVYDEYRLVGVDYHIQAVGLNNGVTKFVVDDSEASTPSLSWIENRAGYLLSNNSCAGNSHKVIRYRAQDLSDLTWQGTYSAASYTPFALKMYTNATNMGTTPSVNLFYIWWVGHFEFRGIGANQ